jgi:large subunit ribosomal protein L4
MPRKVKQYALKVALSYLAKNGKLFVVNDMVSEGKTGELSKRLKGFGVSKAVLIDATESAQFKRAARNLEKYRYYSVDGMNVYDLLKYDTAIITKPSLEMKPKPLSVFFLIIPFIVVMCVEID